jgi:hypothetical protein
MPGYSRPYALMRPITASPSRAPYPEARAAGAALIAEGIHYEPRRKTYIYVNNRLEGNALETIAQILEQIRRVNLLPPGLW